MKKRWVVFQVSAGCLLLTAGIWLGVQAEASRSLKQQTYIDSIPSTLAVVNQDMGAINEGGRENYSAAIIDTLGSEYVLVSAQAAQTGYDQGVYGGIITFPSSLSAHVISINSSNPEKVTLSYLINPKLPEAKYIEAYQRVIDLQNEINHMLAYMYVYSIYTELHEAQAQVDEIFRNDEEDMEALARLELHDFTAELNLDAVPRPPLDLKRLDFESFVMQVRGYADSISDEYLDSYTEASEAYDAFEQRLIDLTQEIDEQSIVWQDEIQKWEQGVESRNLEVEEYGKELNSWLVAAKRWSEANASWQTELEDFQEKAQEYYGKVSGFLENVEGWRTDAAAWGDGVKALQSERESSVIAALEQYNSSYSSLNTYQTALETWAAALQEWEENVQAYADSLPKEPPEQPEPPDPVNDVEKPAPPPDVKNASDAGEIEPPSDGQAIAPADPAHSDESAQNGNVPPSGEEKGQDTIALLSPQSGTRQFSLHILQPFGESKAADKDVQEEPEPPPYGEAPELMLPPDFELPQPLEVLPPWDEIPFDEPPSPEHAGEFTETLPIPPDFVNDVVLPEIPEYPERKELLFPVRPERYDSALREIEDDTPWYNPSRYLTADVQSGAYGYVDDYREHVYTVRETLLDTQVGNSSLLEDAYTGFNDYVANLRESALSTHKLGQQKLSAGIQGFSGVKNATSLENRQLLSAFAAMMPNSRMNSTLNKSVVEFTVAPIVFADTTVRAAQSDGNYEAAELLHTIEKLLLCGFLISCLSLLYISLSFLLRRSTDDERMEPKHNRRTKSDRVPVRRKQTG